MGKVFDSVQFVKNEIYNMEELHEYLVTADLWARAHGLPEPKDKSYLKGLSNGLITDRAHKYFVDKGDLSVLEDLNEVIQVVALNIVLTTPQRFVLSKDGLSVVVSSFGFMLLKEGVGMFGYIYQGTRGGFSYIGFKEIEDEESTIHKLLYGDAERASQISALLNELIDRLPS